MKETIIKNSDGDFLQIQNYVLQLVAEKKITQSAFILYSFYRSIAGFSEIRCGYNYISLNSGISKGSITAGNKLLEKNGLIKIIHKGRNNPFEIIITPGSTLPRREFKVPDYDNDSSSTNEHPVQPMNSNESLSSNNELIKKDTNKNRFYKNSTTGKKSKKFAKNKKWSKEHELLKEKFIKHWQEYYNTDIYPKKDVNKLLEIDKPLVAIKYIPVLWSLDEVDQWIHNSDHSVTIFVKEYLSSRLETYYPNTKYYYLDRQNT
jgi:hypothetical protein